MRLCATAMPPPRMGGPWDPACARAFARLSVFTHHGCECKLRPRCELRSGGSVSSGEKLSIISGVFTRDDPMQVPVEHAWSTHPLRELRRRRALGYRRHHVARQLSLAYTQAHWEQRCVGAGAQVVTADLDPRSFDQRRTHSFRGSVPSEVRTGRHPLFAAFRSKMCVSHRAASRIWCMPCR
jgi:hypothetical protein